MSHEYIVKQSEEICKSLNQLRFRKILSDVYMEHIMAIIHLLVHFLCCTLPDYRGAFEKGFAYFRECLLQA